MKEAEEFNSRCQQLENRFRRMMEQETSSQVWVATVCRTLGLLLQLQNSPKDAFEQVVKTIQKHAFPIADNQGTVSEKK